MGFCKPGDPCWNYQLGNVNTARILEWQQEALQTAAECGIDIPAFGDFCQQVRDCVTGDTHHSLTACTIYVDVIHPCTTGTTFTSDVVVEGDTLVEGTLESTGNITGATNVHVGGDLFTDQIRRAGSNAQTTKMNLQANSLEFYVGDSSDERVKILSDNVVVYKPLNISGNTTTINFQMTSGPTAGYVLTSDASGNASWQASSGGGGGTFTGNTSGDCIQELWVSTISGCSPVIMGPSVGIGTDTPTGPFEVKDYISFQTSDTTTLIGYEAGLGWENTSENNTMIGHFAGKGGGPGYGPWVGADDNTGVGYLSMGFLTTGGKNTAIGSVSIGTLTTGSENTIVGYNAGYSTSRDNKNTVVGSEAHAQVYGGGGDTTPGTDAFNVAVGYRSLYFPNRGYKNVALGAQALAGSGVMVAGNQGAVAVGYNALNASQSGDYNIAIGYQAADNITTGDNNISIGKDADPPSATASYQMNIGGIIHGRDIDGSSSINTIGIGTTSPNEKLTVVGAVSATSQLYFSEIDGGSF